MTKEKLARNIEKRAGTFKRRARRSPNDGKRHDHIRTDEKECMGVAYVKLGWSLAKIGGIFNRSPRVVGKAVQRLEHEKQTGNQPSQQAPLLAGAREKHWSDLVIVAQGLQSALMIPSLVWYWLPLHYSDGSGSFVEEWMTRYNALLATWNLKEPFISDVESILFDSLVTHLQTESGDFQLETLGEWKVSTRKIVWDCIRFSVSTFLSRIEALGLNPDEIFSEGTRQVLEDGQELGMKDIIPLVVLVPDVWKEYQRACSDDGEPDPKLSWITFWSGLQLEHFSLGEQGRTLTERIDGANRAIQPVRDLLSLVGHKRTFAGTCDICVSWGML